MDRLIIQCCCGYSFSVARKQLKENPNGVVECPGRGMKSCRRVFRASDLLKMIGVQAVYYVENKQENLGLKG
jgi:superfamily II DNA/RNA helicase